MRKPRILFVSPVPDMKGGAERVLMDMLASPYVEPVLAVPWEGELGEQAARMGVPVRCYRPGALMAIHRPPQLSTIAAAAGDALRCAWRLRRIAREENCDAVHSNGLKAHALNAILGATSRVRTIAHLHDIPYRRSERLIWRAIRVCVDQTLVVSPPCWPGVRRPRNVHVVPNGIVPIRRALEPVTALPQPLRLGFVGRFHPNKGLDLLLDWVAATRASGLDAVLALRGRSDPDQPAYWERIRSRIKVEGLEPVVACQGWVGRDALYDGIDVLLVPSDIPDPAPLVVGEAMSAGVVVIGYPAGGMPTLIRDGETGFLAAEPAAVAAILRRLARAPGAYERIRQAAHAHALSAVGRDSWHSRLAAIHGAAAQLGGRGLLPYSTP